MSTYYPITVIHRYPLNNIHLIWNLSNKLKSLFLKHLRPKQILTNYVICNQQYLQFNCRWSFTPPPQIRCKSMQTVAYYRRLHETKTCIKAIKALMKVAWGLLKVNIYIVQEVMVRRGKKLGEFNLFYGGHDSLFDSFYNRGKLLSAPYPAKNSNIIDCFAFLLSNWFKYKIRFDYS